MLKKFSTLALMAMLALPLSAQAGQEEDPAVMARQIKVLTRQLHELQESMASQTTKGDVKKEDFDDLMNTVDDLEQRSESWDLSARVKFYGDFRARYDYNSTNVPAYFNAREVAVAMRGFGLTAASSPTDIRNAFNGFLAMAPTVAARQALLGGTALMQPAHKVGNDSQFTNRFRLNMRVKATDNVEFKARLVGYKVWGMQSSPFPETVDSVYSPFFLTTRSFDGTSAREPADSSLLVDRAFLNWNNIGGAPVWFSIGRRPTTDGPPAHLRMGTDKRMATPISYMDYPFDGISLGYAYRAPLGLDGSGRIRFCYGRGFEAGLQQSGSSELDDTDFAGISWDILKQGNRFINLQVFGAFNIFNVPGDTFYPNPIKIAEALANPNYTGDTNLTRINMGDIYHTSLIYMDKIEAASLHYFLTAGWSHTNATAVDELGASLLGSWGVEPENKDGYGLYGGIRYDLDQIGLKLGAELNYGSKNWLAFTPGHDDYTQSKLNTRGTVVEAYLIYDLPTGEAISKYAKTFVRLGYQHYDYDYTYSGMWLGTPTKIEELNDPAMAQLYAPTKDMDQVYLTLEAYF